MVLSTFLHCAGLLLFFVMGVAMLRVCDHRRAVMVAKCGPSQVILSRILGPFGNTWTITTPEDLRVTTSVEPNSMGGQDMLDTTHSHLSSMEITQSTLD